MITWENDCIISQKMDISSAKEAIGGIHIAFALNNDHLAARRINREEKVSLFGSAGHAQLLRIASIPLHFHIQNLRSQDNVLIGGNGTISFTSVITDNSDIADINMMNGLFQEKVTIAEIMDSYSINIAANCFGHEIAKNDWALLDNSPELFQNIKERANNDKNIGGDLLKRFGLRINDISVIWEANYGQNRTSSPQNPEPGKDGADDIENEKPISITACIFYGVGFFAAITTTILNAPRIMSLIAEDVSETTSIVIFLAISSMMILTGIFFIKAFQEHPERRWWLLAVTLIFAVIAAGIYTTTVTVSESSLPLNGNFAPSQGDSFAETADTCTTSDIVPEENIPPAS